MSEVLHRPAGGRAVMAERLDPTDALDFFPTPPWATRALIEHVLNAGDWCGLDAWDGCAGEGHMAEVLREYFSDVFASDIRDYGQGYAVGSFLGEGADLAAPPRRPAWIIMNPPFNLGSQFARRAIAEARCGVALLLRTAWLESHERYELFSKCPPSSVSVFVERVPMTKGRWDPAASTATSYVWFVWRKALLEAGARTDLNWIPPGRRVALTRPDDVARFDTIFTRAAVIECGEAYTHREGWHAYMDTGNALIRLLPLAMRKLGERYRVHPGAPPAVVELAGTMITSADAAQHKRECNVRPGGITAQIAHNRGAVA